MRSFLRYRLYGLWDVEGRRVHLRGNLVHHEQVRRKGYQQRLSLIEGQAGIEPVLLILLLEYHRHPIVNLGDEGIGLGGQEGEDRVRFALGIMHRTPEPSKGKGFLGLQGNPVGHLALTRTFPLIEAIR